MVSESCYIAQLLSQYIITLYVVFITLLASMLQKREFTILFDQLYSVILLYFIFNRQAKMMSLISLGLGYIVGIFSNFRQFQLVSRKKVRSVRRTTRYLRLCVSVCVSCAVRHNPGAS